MYEKLTTLVLHWLRVPPEPHPPHGDPASLRVFRAGKNFYRMKLAGWGIAQLLALAGIVFWVAVFIDIEVEMHARRLKHEQPVAFTDARNFEDYVKRIGAAAETETPSGMPAASGANKPAPRVKINGWRGFRRMLVEVAMGLPLWAFPVLWVLKLAGIVAYVAQLPVTFAVTRLDYEMRWYMVTDRSLRIRHGIWKIAESTMSFANIQQVVVSQNPLQRLLGLADVRVQSAGGGGHEKHEPGASGHDLHLGLFHHVTNAPEIRDLILARLRHFREAGLGDPDDKSPRAVSTPASGTSSDLLAAARDFSSEVRALRSVLR